MRRMKWQLKRKVNNQLEDVDENFEKTMKNKTREKEINIIKEIKKTKGKHRNKDKVCRIKEKMFYELKISFLFY